MITLTVGCTALETYPRPAHHGRHKIPTTWQTCWAEDGELLIDGDCAGRETREVYWPRKQVRIALNAHLHPAAHTDAARWAMTLWNEWTGREIFVETVVAHDIQVVPAQMGGRTIGLAIHRLEAGVQVGVVFVSPSTTANLERLYAHEFGHMLGLAHDPHHKLSVMYPTVIDGRFELRPEDRQALRRIYGRP